jgi:hypothetical protein
MIISFIILQNRTERSLTADLFFKTLQIGTKSQLEVWWAAMPFKNSSLKKFPLLYSLHKGR